MQTSQGNDFEVINIFNTLTLEALSRRRVNDVWRPFNVFEVLITKSLATSNLGISQASTLTVYCVFFWPDMWSLHFSHKRVLGRGLQVALLVTMNYHYLNFVKIIKPTS